MAGPFGQTSNQSQTQAEGAPPDPTRAGSCALKFPGLDARLGRCLDRQPPPSLKPDRSLCSGTNKLQTASPPLDRHPCLPPLQSYTTPGLNTVIATDSLDPVNQSESQSLPLRRILIAQKSYNTTEKSSRMGRIISFKPPAYHSVSRSTSPVMDDPADSEIISVPRYMSPESPSLSPSRASNKVCHLGQTLPSE